jgi:hypothetical protein
VREEDDDVASLDPFLGETGGTCLSGSQQLVM